jgi:hypothetical protein
MSVPSKPESQGFSSTQRAQTRLMVQYPLPDISQIKPGKNTFNTPTTGGENKEVSFAWFRWKRATSLVQGGSFYSTFFRLDLCLFHAYTLEMVQSCTSPSYADYQRIECCHILKDTTFLYDRSNSLKIPASHSSVSCFLNAGSLCV